MGEDDIFAPFDEAKWAGRVYRGIMPPSDDKPLPTPRMPGNKKWWKSHALINGIPVDEYIRLQVAGHTPFVRPALVNGEAVWVDEHGREVRAIPDNDIVPYARRGTGNLSMEDAQRLYDEMRDELLH